MHCTVSTVGTGAAASLRHRNHRRAPAAGEAASRPQVRLSHTQIHAPGNHL